MLVKVVDKVKGLKSGASATCDFFMDHLQTSDGRSRLVSGAHFCFKQSEAGTGSDGCLSRPRKCHRGLARTQASPQGIKAGRKGGSGLHQSASLL